jgi:hypothetical protein
LNPLCSFSYFTSQSDSISLLNFSALPFLSFPPYVYLAISYNCLLTDLSNLASIVTSSFMDNPLRSNPYRSILFNFIIASFIACTWI